MKRVFIILVVLTMTIYFLTCSNEQRYSIYDDNSAIINRSVNSYSAFGSLQTNIGNVFTYRARGFSGIKMAGTIDGGASFDVDLSVKSGRFKLVLVGDNRVILVTDENVNTTFQFPELGDRKYSLRMVGDRARVNLRINFSDNPDVPQQFVYYNL